MSAAARTPRCVPRGSRWSRCAVAEAEQRAQSRHRREPLVEHRLAGIAIERLEDQAHVAGVEDQVVDVEQDAAPCGSGANDQAVEARRVSRPADDQRADVADEALEDGQLGSGEPGPEIG